MKQSSPPSPRSDFPRETRRDFLTTSAGLASASLLLPNLTPAVHAAGGDTLRVGLIGCGNRGSGAAVQALRGDPNVKLVAMGDVFKDRIQSSLREIRKEEDLARKIDVKPECCFDGFDNYKKVLAAGVDVVLLATPPGFRPLHLKAAVEAGKHIFCEKPMAVDGPGVRSVIETVAAAKKKNLALVAGFCYRYEKAKQEFFQRIHDGALGKIVALQSAYNTGGLWHRLREKDWDDMTYQLRNWLYYTWLSGDHIVEQACHSLDKMAWAMHDEPPIKCFGLGGRQTRTSKEFGHIFDHFAITYEYKNGVRMFHTCRQQKGCTVDNSDTILGSDGIGRIVEVNVSHTITGKKPWKHRRQRGDKSDMYQNEHDALFASIRSGKPINDGDRMASSSLLSIMGRMAAYTGQVVTWERALNSTVDLMPTRYEFGPLPTPAVAQPGVTKLV
jgi:predicted dehydrogenase